MRTYEISGIIRVKSQHLPPGISVIDRSGWGCSLSIDFSRVASVALGLKRVKSDISLIETNHGLRIRLFAKSVNRYHAKMQYFQ